MPRALGNALLAACSLALCLLALEGLARLERRGREGGKEQRERLTYIEHDPLLGWRKIPGAEASHPRRDFSTDIRINSHGLRDPERDYPAAPGTLRVVALGDSFLEAYQVPLEDSVTQRLERSLSDGCSAEVINGGTPGYGLAQEYLLFEQEGVRYAPRVVLLLLPLQRHPLHGTPAPARHPEAAPGFRLPGAPGRDLPRPLAGEPRVASPAGPDLPGLRGLRLARGSPGAGSAPALQPAGRVRPSAGRPTRGAGRCSGSRPRRPRRPGTGPSAFSRH